MDQHGIGNIVKSEVLYDANSDREWKRLYNSSKKITNKVYNEILKMSFSKFKKFINYQQEKDPMGNKVRRYESKDGRVTFWVANIQI
jgi:hypothetical protein